MKKAFLTFTTVLLFHMAFAQSGGLQIRAINSEAIDYCTEAVALGDRVSVTGADISGGLKISISNYIKGEDLLSFDSTPTIRANWEDATGSLILSGNATAADYQEAVRNIEYTNLAASPTNGSRSVAITLKDVDYFPATGHFYRYISSLGIPWANAKTQAEGKDYYGLKGYLATITSSEENDFIWSKVQGVGWIGATDEDVEGDWKWMTGPEADILFWRGTYNGGQRINNRYSFWSSNEPNNAHTDTNGGVGEDYAHINQDPNQEDKSWNDLRTNGDGSSSQYYYPRGYVIEFGGMPGDPDISLSAVLQINVWNILFDDEIEKTICQYDTVRLNHEFAGNYEWYPKTGLDDPYRSDPLASPMDTTVYKVILRNGTCADSATFTLNVKPSPIVDFGDDRNICEGMTTYLDAGSHQSYEWNNGYDQEVLTTGEAGNYKVRVGNEFGCFSEDEVKVTVHTYPKIDLSNTDTLFCDEMSGNVKVAVDKGNIEWLPLAAELDFANPASAQTQANVSAYGTYKTYLKVTDDFSCQTSDSLNLSFYHTPTNDFSIDSAECYGYNLGVHYEGDGSLDAEYTWYFLDSVYASGIGLVDMTVALGFDGNDKRDLGLIVNEGGCMNPIHTEHISVIPNLEMKVLDDDGCEPFLVNFEAKTTEPVSNFTWYFGDGDSLKTKSPQHTYLDDGFYDVGLRIISDEGCENYGLIEEMIKVRPVPTVETSLDPDSCYPHILEVSYTGSANPQDTYHWDFSTLEAEELLQDPGTGQGPIAISLKNKPQSTIGLQITTEYSCESEIGQFSFKRKPWVDFVSDLDEGCPPLEIYFQAITRDSLDMLTYQWDFDQDKGYQAGANEMTNMFYTPDHQFDVSGIVESSVTACIDTVWLSDRVQVYPKPTAFFRADTNEVSIVNPEFNFQNLSENARNYFWNFGDSIGYSSETEPTYKYHKMGWFDVEMIAENELFCTDTANQQVLVAFDKIFPPNAFGPNSSALVNREFLLAADGVVTEGYQMQIFNRWGERIFEAKDEFLAWDGKMQNGQFAPTGVYTWVMGYQDFLGRNHRQNGTVTLVY